MEKRTCRAKTQEGRRCRNNASPGSPFCSTHAGGVRRPTILDGVLPQEEIERLAELMTDPQVDDAMIVLAYALRQAVVEGADAKEVIRACDSYVKALVARHKISGRTAESLEQALGAALDAIATELGVEL
jgi:MoxR-like ATPase